ncbi:MAG: hypothetical protein GX130_03870 [Candidatus Hydrogenedens sp.]|jgi:hypothetical protein|nr:hypothetical protein [Candidatus Hydrogenedens sp.]
MVFSLLLILSLPAEIPQNFAGITPGVAEVFGNIPSHFEEYDLILQPDTLEAGWWAGAPSVYRDDAGVFWMACRMRNATDARGTRGYEIRILKSEDGIQFEKVHSIKREEVPIPGFERPALLQDPQSRAAKLYACGPWRGGPWSIIKFDDAPAPDQFKASTARVVIAPFEKSYEHDIIPVEYKDPVILHAEGAWHCHVIGYLRKNERIYHFTSQDGEHWEPVGSPYESVMELQHWHDFFVRPASVLPLGVGYLFIYEGASVNWYEPVYNIGTGLGFSFDLHHIQDLTVESPLILSSTPSKTAHTWRYSDWLWVDEEIWVYAEVAAESGIHEIRRYSLSTREKETKREHP